MHFAFIYQRYFRWHPIFQASSTDWLIRSWWFISWPQNNIMKTGYFWINSSISVIIFIVLYTRVCFKDNDLNVLTGRRVSTSKQQLPPLPPLKSFSLFHALLILFYFKSNDNLHLHSSLAIFSGIPSSSLTPWREIVQFLPQTLSICVLVTYRRQ